MHELGPEGAAVTLLDVNHEQAQQITLIDNQRNDLAGYDERLVAEPPSSRTQVIGPPSPCAAQTNRSAPHLTFSRPTIPRSA